jgi:hypothetical protein
MADKDITHGMSHTKLYSTWCNMKARCNNKLNDFYHRYGGRGITYSPKWETFEGFIEDMLESYFEDASIERLNIHKNYSKENCVWILLKDQSKNKGMQVNNSSGLTGCDLYWNRIGVCYVRSRWNDETGKPCAKYFNINKYGEKEAWELAYNLRVSKLKAMGYGENHGK